MDAAILVAALYWCWVGQVQQTDPPRSSTPEGVEVRYARAQLQLAEANLKRVEQSNQQMERTVPSSVVAEYQHDVQVAKLRLDRASAGRAADQFPVWLQRADAERQAAETALNNANAANKSVPGTIVPIDIERFRLRSEVAKLQLERGQTLVNAGHEAQLQWEVEMLDNQVQRLNEESRRVTAYGGLDLPWWW
jgi:hypothetical protein